MNFSRRHFVATSTAAAAVFVPGSPTAVAADPPLHSAGSQFKLSLAAYSFHRMMVRRGSPEQIAAAKMTLEKFIDFSAARSLGAVELTSYYFPKIVTNEYLMTLKQRTHRLGLSISGTAIGNDFCLPDGVERDAQLADCRAWIDFAAVMGAPAIRIFAGKVPPGDSIETAIARCAKGINDSLKYAATRGVFLALENHGGITATPEQMLRIIEQVDDSPWFGVNFDSGNFRTQDPYGDLEKIAPYAVNAQIKVMISPNGNKEPADIDRIVEILRQAGYRGYVVLEYEEREDPFVAIPRHLETLARAIES
ncbi:MAG: sugar phosphate isomerase/epimerase family protein [Planctomycetaceae bacterium]|jgi:sugar phosphate isomerase/epimerase